MSTSCPRLVHRNRLDVSRSLPLRRRRSRGHCAPLCRSSAIGDARSLPWGTAWWQGRPDYNLANLRAPTPKRCSCLRRRSSSAWKPSAGRPSTRAATATVAERLLSTLMTRARNAEQAGRPDALAFFDAAYAANTLYQIGAYDDVPEVRDLVPRAKGLVRDGDPYKLVKKSLALRPDDAGLQFGAALIASLRPGESPGMPRTFTEGARRRPPRTRCSRWNLRYIS